MVLAAVIRKRGRILIARRKATDRFGGRWEFPGESSNPARRPKAVSKESSWRSSGSRPASDGLSGPSCADPAGLAIRLDAYEAVHQAGEFELREHDEIRWVWPSELAGFELTEPDRRLLDRILKKRDEKQR